MRLRTQVSLKGIMRIPWTDTVKSCGKCDGPGGRVTYRNQIAMPIRGKVHCIDFCIHRIVAALNAANVVTTASCCGHETIPGIINLLDGRVLAILDSQKRFEEMLEAMKYGIPGSNERIRQRENSLQE